MQNAPRPCCEPRPFSRRSFVRLATAGAGAAAAAWEGWPSARAADAPPPELAKALETLEPYFTAQDKFRDVSRGQPLPHSLPEQTKRKVGMTRESWKLEVISDPEHPATLRRPYTQKAGTALDFDGLMKLAEKHAVRFAKSMTCLNIGRPLGTGVWEGVPLRELIWLTQPRENLRRVFYHGYHNDDPKQMFRSSLAIDRVLEDPAGLPPVIVCYKLNGQWLTSERGGPVRIVVPEAYGFKSIKWLAQITLSNLFHANDTYADGNNDVDSALKTFAATFPLANKIKAGRRLPVTGFAQVGMAGLSKVQVWVQSNAVDWPGGDPFFTSAPWTDAQILPPPTHWGDLAQGRIPGGTLNFDPVSGRPTVWPMRLTKVYWSALLPELAAGSYTLRSRTLDEKGQAQPLPRPFQKSGHAAIEAVEFTVS